MNSVKYETSPVWNKNNLKCENLITFIAFHIEDGWASHTYAVRKPKYTKAEEILITRSSCL